MIRDEVAHTTPRRLITPEGIATSCARGRPGWRAARSPHHPGRDRNNTFYCQYKTSAGRLITPEGIATPPGQPPPSSTHVASSPRKGSQPAGDPVAVRAAQVASSPRKGSQPDGTRTELLYEDLVASSPRKGSQRDRGRPAHLTSRPGRLITPEGSQHLARAVGVFLADLVASSPRKGSQRGLRCGGQGRGRVASSPRKGSQHGLAMLLQGDRGPVASSPRKGSQHEFPSALRGMAESPHHPGRDRKYTRVTLS